MFKSLIGVKIIDVLERIELQLKRLADSAERLAPPIVGEAPIARKLQADDLRIVTPRKLWEWEQQEKARKEAGLPPNQPQLSPSISRNP